ncbi:MAG: ABC transporter permease [Bacillaceae bacterium]|nr:ABC transporter permease [Bacillaceae bacterium]
MIGSVKGLTYRFIRANKWIVASSVISVMLSIFLIVTMTVFSSSAKQSLILQNQQLYGDADLLVGYHAGQEKLIDKRLFDQITLQGGIERISPVLVSHLQVASLKGDIYTVGIENDALAKSRFHFQGELASDDVIVNESLAEALKIHVGDSMMIDNRSLKVKQILADFDGMGVAPDILIMARGTLKQMLDDKTGINDAVATYIMIEKAEAADVYTLADRIRQVDTDLRIDVAEQDEGLKQNLTYLTGMMIVLSGLVLIIASLFTISNFEVLMYKYRNQFAIMRSMGATKRQLFHIVLRLGLAINLAGAGSGLVLALISYRFLTTWMGDLFSVPVSVTSFPWTRSVIVTLSSMIVIQILLCIPGFRAAKILPVRLMQENEREDFASPKWRRRSGFVMLAGSLMLIVFGKTNSSGLADLLILFAVLMMVIGIFVLFPVYLSHALARLLPVFNRIFGRTSYVAIKNVMPHVRKNTFLMLTICAMMVIVVFGSAALKSMQTNHQKYLSDQYVSDIVMTSRLSHSHIDPSELREAIRQIDGVEEASMLSRFSDIGLTKNAKFVHTSYLLADLDEMAKQGFLPELENKKNGIVVTTKVAERLQLKEGDVLQASRYSNERHRDIPVGEVIVLKIMDKLPGTYYDVYLDWDSSAFRNDETTFDRVFISTKDMNGTLAQLEDLTGQYPELKVHTLTEALEQSRQMFVQRWFLFMAVMIVVVLSVMLGTLNTLVHHIHMKRKEYAILRAISLGHRGVVRVIFTQAMLYLVSGVLLGVVSGISVTGVTGLIDSGGVHFDYRFVSTVAGVFVILALLIIVPFAHHIGKSKITLELTRDNK